MKLTHCLLAIAAGVLLVGCQSAYYATMEKFGYAKRDILVDRVEDAREQQQDTQEQFQSTYEALQALTGFEGGELESLYNKLKGEYDDASDDAAEVSEKIDSIESVAGAMFKEWAQEIEEMSTASLQENSRRKLTETQAKLDSVVKSMRAAEATMAPVLTKFNDYVLALKHELNAQAIGGLEGEAANIESEIQALIARMQASIAEADAFLADMNANG